MGKNSGKGTDTNRYLIDGTTPNPRHGDDIIPRSVWTKDAIDPSLITPDLGLSNGAIYYNPIYDYLSETHPNFKVGATKGLSVNQLGVGDNILLEFFKNDPDPQARIASFKDSYQEINKKFVIGMYFSPNKLATQWGYKSQSSTPVGEIGTAITNYRWGASEIDDVKTAHGTKDWERYKNEALTVITDHLNSIAYVPGGEIKSYRFEHNVKAVEKRQATHLIPQVFYEKVKTDPSGVPLRDKNKKIIKEKIYVDVDDAMHDSIFNELDFSKA